MTGTILVLNGPNLNLLGVREPEIYGRDTLDDIKKRCVEQASKHGLEVDFRQSNSEATLIDWLHEARGTKVGVAINPAGLSFHSIALLDALKMFDGPKVEVHITNIHKREPMYQKSLPEPSPPLRPKVSPRIMIDGAHVVVVADLKAPVKPSRAPASRRRSRTS